MRYLDIVGDASNYGRPHGFAMVYRTCRGNHQLQQQQFITADLTDHRFSYCQLSGIWTLWEMQNIADALTDLQWFTEHS